MGQDRVGGGPLEMDTSTDRFFRFGVKKWFTLVYLQCKITGEVRKPIWGNILCSMVICGSLEKSTYMEKIGWTEEHWIENIGFRRWDWGYGQMQPYLPLGVVAAFVRESKICSRKIIWRQHDTGVRGSCGNHYSLVFFLVGRFMGDLGRLGELRLFLQQGKNSSLIAWKKKGRPFLWEGRSGWHYESWCLHCWDKRIFMYIRKMHLVQFWLGESMRLGLWT